jgi:hypothetical protein
MTFWGYHYCHLLAYRQNSMAMKFNFLRFVFCCHHLWHLLDEIWTMQSLDLCTILSYSLPLFHLMLTTECIFCKTDTGGIKRATYFDPVVPVLIWFNILIQFLARMWALTITCCPSSVSRAHFVTAGAIDLKLCTYVPLGEITVQTKFWSDLILGLATRGPKPKTQKVL